MKQETQRPLKVLVSPKILERNLDLGNLQTTIEYYFGLNLSGNLIAFQSSTQVVGILAEAWEYSPEKTQLRFRIKTDLKWSDGSPLTAGDLAGYYQQLVSQKNRHLSSFDKLKNIHAKGNELTFELKAPAPELLYQLSLADAGVTNSNFTKTAGPYFLASRTDKEWQLISNKYYAGETNASSPKSVVVLPAPSPEEGARALKAGDYDVAYISFSFVPAYDPYISLGEKYLYPGAFQGTIFLSIDPNFEEDVRRGIIVAANKSALPFASHQIKVGEQVIPPGYPSHLSNYKLPQSSTPLKKPFECVIGLGTEFAELRNPSGTKWADDLKNKLKELNIICEIRFVSWWQLYDPKDHLAGNVRLMAFAGNQVDPASSWKFLLDPQKGSIRGGEDCLRPEKDGFVDYNEVHKCVLDRMLVAPLFFYSPIFAHSKRVDMSDINPLDHRLELWKIKFTPN